MYVMFGGTRWHLSHPSESRVRIVRRRDNRVTVFLSTEQIQHLCADEGTRLTLGMWPEIAEIGIIAGDRGAKVKNSKYVGGRFTKKIDDAMMRMIFANDALTKAYPQEVQLCEYEEKRFVTMRFGTVGSLRGGAGMAEPVINTTLMEQNADFSSGELAKVLQRE